jgi:hypothetical protein
MIYVEVRREDLKAARMEIKNLPGALFGGASPLLKPFMKKLEDILPLEQKGKGDSYTLGALHSHVKSIHADEGAIRVESDGKHVDLTRAELLERIGGKYPTSDHGRLNLPGLLFLQSSPAIQQISIFKLKRDHGLKIPEGRRTIRYIFHLMTVSIDADQEVIRIGLDPGRLPRRADGSDPI